MPVKLSERASFSLPITSVGRHNGETNYGSRGTPSLPRKPINAQIAAVILLVRSGKQRKPRAWTNPVCNPTQQQALRLDLKRADEHRPSIGTNASSRMKAPHVSRHVASLRRQTAAAFRQEPRGCARLHRKTKKLRVSPHVTRPQSQEKGFRNTTCRRSFCH